MKFTPWFPGDVNPVRVGVYERDYHDGYSCYCYWDGRYFGWASETPEAAKADYDRNGRQSTRQDLPWRGLAEEPES